jgi:aldehyde dehydrogenase (NAD+)
MKACEEEGVPPGVVNMVTGSGSALGDPLIKNPAVKVVSFTGSTEIGRKVSEACASTFKHACLEMGGKNVEIVMDDADLDLAVEGALWGAFGTSGQRCTATSRLICHKDVLNKFTAMIVERVKELKVGDGLDEKTEMGPVINQNQLDTVLKYIEIGKKEGAKLLCGGEKLTGKDYDKGFFVQPTVFGGITRTMRLWKE